LKAPLSRIHLPRLSLNPVAARWLVTAFGIATIVGALTIAGYFIQSDRHTLIDTDGADLSRSVRLSATLIDQVVRDSDAIASGLQVAIRLQDGTLAEFAAGNIDWLEQELSSRDVVRTYALLDATGTVIASATDALRGENFAERDYFDIHVDDEDSGRFVSEPILSRLRAAYRLFLISWPLRDRDGDLVGVFALSLDTAQIESLLGQVDDSPHEALALVTASGSILASEGTGGAQALPPDYREPMLIRAASRAIDSSDRRVRTVEGYLWERPSTWLVAATPIETFPAAIVAARDRHAVLAPWRERSTAVGLAALAIAVLTACITLLLREVILRQQREVKRATHVAATDPLTGLFNRRGFADRADAEWSRGRREDYPMAALVLDLDHFKKVNDTYGHEAGDEVLRRVAGRLTEMIRRADILARTGGEEFALLLPRMRPDAIVRFTERVRRAIEAMAIHHEGTAIHVTVSIGICIADPHTETTADALRRADVALYEAKRSGRNRAVLSEPEKTREDHPDRPRLRVVSE